MKATQNPPLSAIVPKRVLKGKDGREPGAEKLAKANEILKKHPCLILSRSDRGSPISSPKAEKMTITMVSMVVFISE